MSLVDDFDGFDIAGRPAGAPASKEHPFDALPRTTPKKPPSPEPTADASAPTQPAFDFGQRMPAPSNFSVDGKGHRMHTGGAVQYPSASKDTVLDALNGDEAVVLLVYANWCPHCQKYLPVFLDGLHATSNGRREGAWMHAGGVVIVAVDDEQTPISDIDDSVAELVDAFPTMLIKNRLGELRTFDRRKMYDFNEIIDDATYE